MEIRPVDVLCNVKNWSSWDFSAYKLQKNEADTVKKALENYIWHEKELEGLPKEPGYYICKVKGTEIDECSMVMVKCTDDPDYFLNPIATIGNNVIAWRKVIE